MRWRPMRASDLAMVEAIAEALHPDHPERPEVFAERLALAPGGCRVLADEVGALHGYAVTHPWGTESPPALDVLLGRLPPRAAAWHIHDIAVLPAARGLGHAARLLHEFCTGAAARGYALATLVAIAGKGGYWERHGFRPIAPRDPAALDSYGAGALFMVRSLA